MPELMKNSDLQQKKQENFNITLDYDLQQGLIHLIWPSEVTTDIHSQCQWFKWEQCGSVTSESRASAQLSKAIVKHFLGTKSY